MTTTTIEERTVTYVLPRHGLKSVEPRVPERVKHVLAKHGRQLVNNGSKYVGKHRAVA